jgi:aminoglycoside phosphotransferase (APT) family kinase protein
MTPAGSSTGIASALEAYLHNERRRTDITVIHVAPFGDGHSGLTYRAETSRRGRREAWVLRLSPPGVRIAGPTDVGRQGRIMDAVSRAGGPAPCTLAFASEPVIEGSAFVMTEEVVGEPWHPVALRRGHRYVAEQAIVALHRIGALRIEQTGLERERPAWPLAELRRWTGLLDRCPEWVREPGHELSAMLAARPPSPRDARLVHGDFHYGNLLFDEDRVVAVIDWEIAHLGSPCEDLACLAVATLRGCYTQEPNPTGSVEIRLTDLVALYGADPEEVRWYVGAACLKYAAIIGFNLQLHLSGKRHDPIYTQLTGTARGLLDDGVAIVGRGVSALDPQASKV